MAEYKKTFENITQLKVVHIYIRTIQFQVAENQARRQHTSVMNNIAVFLNNPLRFLRKEKCEEDAQNKDNSYKVGFYDFYSNTTVFYDIYIYI